MIKIKIPNNFLPERKYIISTLFDEFLGLNYEIETYNKNDYKIVLDNKKELIIKDSFFSNFKNQDYLSVQNIPQSPLQKSNNKFASEKNLPIIYGDNTLETSDNKIVCSLDIFASCFFMLTRWEEYVIKERDKYNRFLAKNSLAYKENFLNRPIVNEYAEMLWNILKYLEINQERKKRKFTVCLTHDVDEIKRYKWYPPLGAIKRAIKNHNLKKVTNIILDYTKTKLYLKKDPYYTTLSEYIIDIEKEYGFRSSFYFMANDERYSLNNPWLKECIKKLKNNNFEIGIHPSFNAYNKPNIIKKEKEKLEKIIGGKVAGGRQHFLKGEAPKSWEVWQRVGLKYDSTLCYADYEGFRCGTCYPFRPFDIIKKEIIDIWEIPLTVMDGTLISYRKLPTEEATKTMTYSLNQVKKYNGVFVLLWHNSYMTSLFTHEWKKCFENFYRIIYKENCVVVPVNKILKETENVK